jgi:hypothetical protein
LIRPDNFAFHLKIIEMPQQSDNEEEEVGKGKVAAAEKMQ